MKKELRIPRTDREDLYLDYINVLEEQVRRDPLTGLLNMKSFSSIDKEEGVYLFLDIDNVKILNDQYKDHQLGTAAIRAVGYVMSEYVDGLSCRYGGDEFLLFLPNVSIAQGEFKGRFLLNQINKTKIDPFYRGMNPVPDWNLTCSAGIGKTIEEADRALYQAKAQGKNQIRKGNEND